MESYGMDKLSSEIFSILESKFLFGNDDRFLHSPNNCKSPFTPSTAASGRVRILSIDAGGATDGLLAATSLARLEASLQRLSGDTSARIADFFDVAAGSGAGGILTALLFARGSNGRPLLSASDALRFVAKNHRLVAGKGSRRTTFSFRALFRGRKGCATASSVNRIFRGIFGDLTLRDTVKPVLVPCYDLITGAPFLFSRADAMETDGYDFKMRDVCAATMGLPSADNVRSVDGKTCIDAAAVDGGVATGNPASAAVTHVLNNKMEFPFVKGVEDLLLLSIGNGEAAGGGLRQPGYATPSPAGIMKIAGDGVSDMIDQAVAMAFGRKRESNYVRIQGREIGSTTSTSSGSSSSTRSNKKWRDDVVGTGLAEEMLRQRNVESVLFFGKKVSAHTNADKLDWAAGELVKEAQIRKQCPLPVVMLRGGSPRSSSSSSSSSSSPSSSSSSP